MVNGNQRQYSNTATHFGSQRSQSPEQGDEHDFGDDQTWGHGWDAKASPTMRAKGARKGSFTGAAQEGPQIVIIFSFNVIEIIILLN